MEGQNPCYPRISAKFVIQNHTCSKEEFNRFQAFHFMVAWECQTIFTPVWKYEIVGAIPCGCPNGPPKKGNHKDWQKGQPQGIAPTGKFTSFEQV
jgi:hypothetical protein